jgi:hypothetical protein
MNTTTNARSGNWPLSRVLMILLAGAFAGLMSDLRVEHVEVVRERVVAWTPIVYSGLMMVACLVTAMVWNDLTRRIMIVLFLAALAVGGTGFYLHNHGRFARVWKRSVNAWVDGEMKHSDAPPQSAPLMIAGLGVMGIVASLKRFSR